MSNLKQIRESKGLSQSQLADKSGVSLRLIQAYEQGYKDIKKAQVVTIIKLADALGKDAKEIINS